MGGQNQVEKCGTSAVVRQRGILLSAHKEYSLSLDIHEKYRFDGTGLAEK